MKELYTEPEMEKVEFAFLDVITTSYDCEATIKPHPTGPENGDEWI